MDNTAFIVTTVIVATVVAGVNYIVPEVPDTYNPDSPEHVLARQQREQHRQETLRAAAAQQMVANNGSSGPVLIQNPDGELAGFGQAENTGKKSIFSKLKGLFSRKTRPPSDGSPNKPSIFSRLKGKMGNMFARKPKTQEPQLPQPAKPSIFSRLKGKMGNMFARKPNVQAMSREKLNSKINETQYNYEQSQQSAYNFEGSVQPGGTPHGYPVPQQAPSKGGYSTLSIFGTEDIFINIGKLLRYAIFVAYSETVTGSKRTGRHMLSLTSKDITPKLLLADYTSSMLIAGAVFVTRVFGERSSTAALKIIIDAHVNLAVLSTLDTKTEMAPFMLMPFYMVYSVCAGKILK